ncbi:hypothetical protein [Fodinicola feengrottensis]|uniref:hypothetical protein n=1 Tax=Fodinicola feengrottensis TaxID=435914 RepID=UPI0031D67E9E
MRRLATSTNIQNDSDRTAISLHVHGIEMRVAGSSVRRRYNAPVLTGHELAQM